MRKSFSRGRVESHQLEMEIFLIFLPNLNPLIQVTLKQNYTSGIFEVMSKFLTIKYKIQAFGSIPRNFNFNKILILMKSVSCGL